MDVTPQELRDVEIREAWRGYHRDDVDELLERAAATIEHLDEQTHQAQARAAQAPTPPPVRTPAVTPPPVAPTPERRVPSVDTDVIQRTLVLAQKAADEAVSEAKATAQQMVRDSETKAQQVVSEAENSARRIADTERRRLEDEIAQLTAARDTLNADVDALERFEAEYRSRVREAIHSELAALDATGRGHDDRPALHNVNVPAPRSWSPPPETWSGTTESVSAVPAGPSPALPSAGAPTVSIQAVPANEQWDSEPAWTDTPTAAVVDDSAERNLPPEAGDSLDDDAFFASLREAVRDDTPLGSREPTGEHYLESEEPDDQKKLFRRRR
jgi:DivIVA domain-containing protein